MNLDDEIKTMLGIDLSQCETKKDKRIKINEAMSDTRTAMNTISPILDGLAEHVSHYPERIKEIKESILQFGSSIKSVKTKYVGGS